MFAFHAKAYFKSTICLGLILFFGFTAAFRTNEVSSTEPAPTPMVQDTPGQSVPVLPKSPPTDLLFDSIRRELSVDHDRSDSRNDSRNDSTLDNQPWIAIESLLKAARKLDTQAAKMEATGNTKMASLFRSKSSTIRGIAVELLGFTQDTDSK